MMLPNITVQQGMSNLTLPVISSEYVCELNQFHMLEGLQKLPKAYFFFVVFTMVLLLVHIYIVPLFRKWKHYKYIGFLFLQGGFSASVWAVIFGVFITFNIPAPTYILLEVCGLVVLILLLFFLVYKFFFKGVKK